MSIVKQTLKKQKRAYFSFIWRGLAFMLLGIYAAIMVLKGGLGDSVNNGRGVNNLVIKLMAWLTERGLDAELVLTYALAGLFCIIAAIGLYYVVRGAYSMASRRTLLGKSVLLHMQSNESFNDLIDAISADMEQEPYTFASVHIGRKWIIDKEVMRLEDVRGVFCIDQGMEDYVLCCVDKANNIWANSLRYADDRDNAAKHLQTLLPDIASGDKNALAVFLHGEAGIAEEINEEEPTHIAVTPIALPANVTFSFVDTDGVPTSNFSYETVRDTLLALENSSAIALRVLTDGVVSEIFFAHEDNVWNVGIIYRQDNEECRIVQSVNVAQAESILDSVIRQKRLPDFYTHA